DIGVIGQDVDDDGGVFGGGGTVCAGDRCIVDRADSNRNCGRFRSQHTVGDGVGEVSRAVEVAIGREGDGAVGIEYDGATGTSRDAGNRQVGAVDVGVIAHQLSGCVRDSGVFDGREAIVVGGR